MIVRMRIIAEAPNELEELPRDQIEELITAYSPDDVADKDYVDSDTGEIVWEKGEKLSHTHVWRELHPQQPFTSEQEATFKRAYLLWSGGEQPSYDVERYPKSFIGSQEFKETGLDDRAAKSFISQWTEENDAALRASEDEEESRAVSEAEARLRELIEQFADGQSEVPEGDPQSTAPDIADNFFYQHPEWRKLARLTGTTKATVKSMVGDAVYEKLLQLGGAKNEVRRLVASELRSIIHEVLLGRSARSLRSRNEAGTSRRERDIEANPEIAAHVDEMEDRAGGRIAEIHDKREKDENGELEEGSSNIYDVVFANCIVTVIFSDDFKRIVEWHVWDE